MDDAFGLESVAVTDQYLPTDDWAAKDSLSRRFRESDRKIHTDFHCKILFDQNGLENYNKNAD